MKIKRLPNLDSVPQRADIGKQIKQARVECGLSQNELGEQAGYKNATAISLIESGDRGISSKKLFLIAHITNLPIEYFFNL